MILWAVTPILLSSQVAFRAHLLSSISQIISKLDLTNNLKTWSAKESQIFKCVCLCVCVCVCACVYVGGRRASFSAAITFPASCHLLGAKKFYPFVQVPSAMGCAALIFCITTAILLP